MSNTPVKRARAKNITAAVWSNTYEKNGQSFEKFSVTVSKRYKKGDEWQSTNNLSMEDVPYVVLVLNKVFADHYIKPEIDDIDL